MKKIYDCFIIRDELDVLELRLKILENKVDKFVICEADRTFTNLPKPYNFVENYHRFQRWEDKIIYVPIELDNTGLDFSKKDIKFTPNSPAWQFEYQQRNAMVYGLKDANLDDLLMFGDVDEIPNPDCIEFVKTPTIHIMDFFYYYVNNRSIGPQDKLWAGTSMLTKKDFNNFPSIQHIRENSSQLFKHIKSGWHWSYLGGKSVIKNKIKSFSHTEYNNEIFLGDTHIEKCLNTGKDIFNRPQMNFEIININKIYSKKILDVLKTFPNFIFK